MLAHLTGILLRAEGDRQRKGYKKQLRNRCGPHMFYPQYALAKRCPNSFHFMLIFVWPLRVILDKPNRPGHRPQFTHGILAQVLT
jgi:hypothetical protein